MPRCVGRAAVCPPRAPSRRQSRTASRRSPGIDDRADTSAGFTIGPLPIESVASRNQLPSASLERHRRRSAQKGGHRRTIKLGSRRAERRAEECDQELGHPRDFRDPDQGDDREERRPADDLERPVLGQDVTRSSLEPYGWRLFGLRGRKQSDQEDREPPTRRARCTPPSHRASQSSETKTIVWPSPAMVIRPKKDTCKRLMATTATIAGRCLAQACTASASSQPSRRRSRRPCPGCALETELARSSGRSVPIATSSTPSEDQRVLQALRSAPARRRRQGSTRGSPARAPGRTEGSRERSSGQTDPREARPFAVGLRRLTPQYSRRLCSVLPGLDSAHADSMPRVSRLQSAGGSGDDRPSMAPRSQTT